MAEWYDFDEDFWDEYYGAEDETNMASLANDLAESTVPDINWSIFDENPTSRDLQPFDWEDDWILFEFDHDEYYDTRSSISIRPGKSSSSSQSPTPYPAIMDEVSASLASAVATQQQFHHDPVAVSAKGAAAIAASDSTMTDDVDDSIDGGLRKKRPDIQISQSSSSSDKNNNTGQTSRSQSSDRSGSIGTRSRRSRTPVPNPNTGPQPGEVIEILHEDAEKKVVIVHTGGVLGKLRVIRKDSVQPPVTAGPGPSPLRNSLSPSPDTVSLVVDAPTPK
ncbi:hypothetical protein TWF970_002816 [Orbilia oligospora]|uniref:Uncharacterized protein n=1 Tax=Orbilia oligospora TaxID=2813651 RepID=A0A7C8V897_ORBOL|nr:hypothetical protein TWF970_002816 [Orbilia oligospora]